MKRLLLTLFAALVCGCTPATPSAPVRETQAPVAEGEDIRGDWVLVDLDGRAAADQPADGDIPAAIRLVVGDRTVRATSQCVGFAWSYEKSAHTIRLKRANPGAMCARGLTTWESNFDRVMNAVTEARIADGALRLIGGAGELEFARAASPASANLIGEWVLTRLDGSEARKGLDPPEDISLTITREAMRAQSQCVPYWWRYRQSGEQLELTPEDPGPVCERTRTPWEQRFERILDNVSIGHLKDSRTLILDGAAGQAELHRRE